MTNEQLDHMKQTKPLPHLIHAWKLIHSMVLGGSFVDGLIVLVNGGRFENIFARFYFKLIFGGIYKEVYYSLQYILTF